MGRAPHHLPWGKWRLFGAELLLALLLAAVLGPMLGAHRAGHGLPGSLGPWLGLGTALVVVWLALYAADLFEVQVARRDRPRGRRLLLCLGAALLALALVGPWLRKMGTDPGSLLSTAGAVLLALAFTRPHAPTLGRLSQASRRVALAGDREALASMVADIEEDSDAVVEVVARLDLGDPNLGDRVVRAGADLLVICPRQRRGELDMEALLEIALQGIEVLEGPVFAERYLRRIPLEGLLPVHLVFGAGVGLGTVERALLRVLNIGGTLLLLTLAWPLLLLGALAVRLDSPGPIFYRQERVGLGGRLFTLMKLRTMTVDAEQGGARWATVGDARITRVGKWLRRWRLDELPQLLNVLRGDMSLVGPRPERPEFVRKLKQAIPFYGLRESVPPGLSGWAQVRCSYASTIEEQGRKLEHDLYYVRHRGLLLDLAVLLRTAKVVVLGRGAR